MKQLKQVPANDTFGALTLATEVIDGKLAGFISGPEVNGVPPKLDLPETVADDVGFIVESSGSTGTPKRIELSVGALLASAAASQKRIGSGQWLLALPVNYIAGLNVLIRSVLADTQPVMLNSQLPFTPEAFIRSAFLMTKDRYTSLVPYQALQLARQTSDQEVLNTLKSFRAILVGGQAVPQEVLALRDLGVNIVQSYGMAETSGGCVYDGVPLDGVSVEIVDQRIAISCTMLANGLGKSYLAPDLGEITDGILKVLGRADRVIISGGIKLSLDQVENWALSSGVDKVVAVSLRSEFGESVGIGYQSGSEIDFEFLAGYSKAARPLRTLRFEKLPLLLSGKPDLISIHQALDSMES